MRICPEVSLATFWCGEVTWCPDWNKELFKRNIAEISYKIISSVSTAHIFQVHPVTQNKFRLVCPFSCVEFLTYIQRKYMIRQPTSILQVPNCKFPFKGNLIVHWWTNIAIGSREVAARYIFPHRYGWLQCHFQISHTYENPGNHFAVIHTLAVICKTEA